MSSHHPLDPATPDEISIASSVIKAYHGKPVIFRVVDINEPKKADVLRYNEALAAGLTPPQVPRLAKVYFVTKGTNDTFKALVDIPAKKVVMFEQLPLGVQAPLNPSELAQMEDVCLSHPKVVAEIKKLCLPPGYIPIVDPWIYGTDDPNEKRGLVQFYVYLKQQDHPESNHYSLPLKFSPVFDIATYEFVRMDYLPSGLDEKYIEQLPYPGYKAVEYAPELTGLKPREGLKPWIVVQPEGPSFSRKGNYVEWQGWSFYVGFNYREGLVLYDMKFKGHDIFYRVSLSEMTVPYGDGRPPFHRKQAFDLGDIGFGASNPGLKLGCDCVGNIAYFDGARVDTDGTPIKIPNAICMHEQDDGILMKHWNYRTPADALDKDGNPMQSLARHRKLIVQQFATVANYEYGVEFILDQIGTLDIRVRATGILSTMPIDDNITVPWGTIVGPGVVAAYHQHMLAFRIDPAIGGHKNTLMYQDSVRLPKEPKMNPYGVGFITKQNYVETSGYVDQNPLENREFKIINEHKINPITKKPIAYKIKMPAAQMLIAEESSYNSSRAKFATRPFWVTKYDDERLYAAGEFTNQSQMDTGINLWATGTEKVRDEDIVVWANMGFTHIPRPEDFPVMPVEVHEIHITPSGFFECNPALDVPRPNNRFNKSTIVADESKADCCKI